MLLDDIAKGTTSAFEPLQVKDPILSIENLSVMYSDGKESLININLPIPANQISVLFGPSGGGKSTLLRTLNRLNDLADVEKLSGHIWFEGMDLLDLSIDPINLRRRIGIVFARPVVLPMTIRQNLTYGLEIAGIHKHAVLDEAVEQSLKAAALWDEVEDRLDDSAGALSGGQQQRLCLARVLALEPEIILLDEPTSGLDPISTGKVEESLQKLKETYTIILVPHSVQQAARTADLAAFFLEGRLIEASFGKTLFTKPRLDQTRDYVEGRFG
ncbi:MAG: phosphate ABC transporter ATP-binding protein [Anaerolineales bacterium]|nr:phosphate ABC transporter ATP-binding protein [Anaerolineales bacterium]